MADTQSKKALQQKRAKKKQDKLEKREERKSNNDKGKSLEEMTVYLDENGNFTNIPPDKQKRKKINAEDIVLGTNFQSEPERYTGIIKTLFEDKGFGFIKEDDSDQSVFVHNNKMLEPLVENDRVIYDKEKTPKGFAAINVSKIK